jgi:glutathione S-transferase
VLTLEAAGLKRGIDYEIKTPAEAPPGCGFAVPMVTFPNGVTVAQTTAILDLLGEQLGLNGSTAEEKMLCKQYLLDMTDVFSEAVSGKFASNPERADKWFAHLEAKLTNSFFLGSSPTVVDFYGVFTFCWVVAKGANFDKFEKLSRWWATIQEVPVVKNMRESGIAMIPA